MFYFGIVDVLQVRPLFSHSYYRGARALLLACHVCISTCIRVDSCHTLHMSCYCGPNACSSHLSQVTYT